MLSRFRLTLSLLFSGRYRYPALVFAGGSVIAVFVHFVTLALDNKIEDAGVTVKGNERILAGSSLTTVTQPLLTVRYNAFHSVLIDSREIPGVLRNLFSAAEKTGIVFEKGNYKVEKDSIAEYSSYTIELPAEGTYSEIYLAIGRFLGNTPAAALERIDFSRTSLTSERVKAKIKILVYLKP